MTGIKNFPLRAPYDLHEKIEKMAAKEGRSVNAQYIYLAKKAVEAAEKEQSK